MEQKHATSGGAAGDVEIDERIRELQPPFLETLAERPWLTFAAKYESYRARGGSRELRQLMSSAIGEVLLELGVDLSAANAVSRVSELYAPTSVVHAYDRLKQIACNARNEYSVEAVLSYNVEWSRTLEICAQNVRPSERRLVDLFVQGLRPTKLGQCVRLAEPATLAEARRLAVQKARDLTTMQRTMESTTVVSDGGSLADTERVTAASRALTSATGKTSHNRSDGGSRGRSDGGSHGFTKSTSGRESPASSPSRPKGPLVCRSCGGEGHKAAVCPSAKLDSLSQLAPSKPARQATSVPATGLAPPGRALLLSATESKDMECPIVRVDLAVGSRSLVGVRALLDTGSVVCLVASTVAAKLKDMGATSMTHAKSLRTAGGAVTVSEFVTAALTVQIGSRTVTVPLTAGVCDVGEDLVLGFPFMKSAGLLLLLDCPTTTPDADAESPTSDAVDFPDDGDCVIDAQADASLRTNLQLLLKDYHDLFEDLGTEPADVNAMSVDLIPGQAPRSVGPRRASPAIQKVIDDQVADLLRLGIIVPSTSSVSSPVVVVKKKDGTRRMCVDYRTVNQCTTSLRYPMPNAKTLLDRMSGKRIFATMDLRSGFHQVPMSQQSQYLTAFATAGGLYEYTRVPFGLKNAPGFFQKTMASVFAGLMGTACEVFVDDILVYGRDSTEFLKNLTAVFERLRKHKLRLKGAKCKFGLGQVEYLGHVVSGTGITLSDSKREALRKVKPPTDAAKVKSFLGLANYFREFVPGYATLVRPLTVLCSGKTQFEWGSAQQAAFEGVRTAILAAPVLAHIDYEKEIVLRTDASMSGVGGVLLQRGQEMDQPIAYVSKAFTPAESRWSTIEQEAYGVFFCITSFSHYLLGHPFLVETDHRNLVYMEKAAAPKVVRWRLRLAEFDFEVRHIPGEQNVVADALSRCLPVVEGAHDAQIAKVHNATVGHRGIQATVAALKSAGTVWDGMNADVDRFIKSCPICQKIRLGNASAAASTRTTVVSEPFSVVSVDTVGPLPADDRGNKYIVVVIDAFSRFVELFPAVDATAVQAARALLEVFGRYGAPRAVRSDNGSQYTATLIKEFLRLVGTQQQLTIPYRPQSNGLVERANGEVMRHVRAIVAERRLNDRWSSVLPLVQRIINATPHLTIGTTPARIMFGDAVHLDRSLLDTGKQPEDTGTTSYEDYIQRLIDGQRVIIDASVKHQDAVVTERLNAGDPGKLPDFEVGDYVVVSYPGRPPGKLMPKWRGPFALVEVGTSLCKCQDLRDNRLLLFHISRLKRFDASRMDDPVHAAILDTGEFMVHSIVGHRRLRAFKGFRPLEFRVRWEGYADEDDTWLPYRNVRDLAALDVYLANHPGLKL